MSRAFLIGVVGVKHWEYMASAMARYLDRIIKGQKTKIGLGVLYDALLFFRVVLSQKTGTYFDNHLARGNAHSLAWGILRDCPGLPSRTPEEAGGHFSRFADFLKSLANEPTVQLNGRLGKQPAVPLNEKDQKTAIDLHDFFAALLRRTAR